MLSIGFILLTHSNESQVLRLVSRLNLVFDEPPIACHHDFSKALFQIDKFPGNIHFVQPYIRTQWGTISLVRAMLEGLRLLYDKSAPDWFYFLSGADYPIRDAESIRSELARTSYDAYLRMRRIDHTQVPDRAAEDGGGLESQAYLRLAYQRYIARSFPIPSWRHPHRGPAARHIHLLNPYLLKRFHPFTESYSCYAGDQWFAGNSRAAAALLAPGHERLLKYLTGRFPPDEAFCPTVLGNTMDLKISNESKHYIRWQAGHHPRLLDETDLPDMLSSNAHFGRKFAPDARVLDALDAHLRVTVS
jgi:hypothetical protein